VIDWSYFLNDCFREKNARSGDRLEQSLRFDEHWLEKGFVGSGRVCLYILARRVASTGSVSGLQVGCPSRDLIHCFTSIVATGWAVRLGR
jgi:hypothetical protein